MSPRRFQIPFHMYPSDIPHASQMPYRNNMLGTCSNILTTFWKHVTNRLETPQKKTIIQVLYVSQIPSACLLDALLYASCMPYRSIQDAYARHSPTPHQELQFHTKHVTNIIETPQHNHRSSKCVPDSLYMPSICLLHASCMPYRIIQDAYERHSRGML